MKFTEKFNLTEWSLNHRHFMYFLVGVILFAGFMSYQRLGRSEDPEFTVKLMVIRASWAGATARQMEEQVTDKIERKLQDVPHLDYLKSYSMAGESVIYVYLEESLDRDEVRPAWFEVRNMVEDIKLELPTGVVGPFYNDRFDDVFSCVYALTGDGFSYEKMREKAELIRREFLQIDDVRKVDLIGVQTEKIYVEPDNAKIMQLGIDPQIIINTIQAQNFVNSTGLMETSSDNVFVRTNGIFEKVEDIKNLPVRFGNTFVRLGEIAKVTRGYDEPNNPTFYFNGEPAIGLQLSMENGGNVLKLGENLSKKVAEIQTHLPFGMEIHQVANQPKVVEESIAEFMKSLAEAVIIVLLVSFITLGLRSGFIVAISIPVVIASVFIGMEILDISLQKISLGALIVALGLLVDDAMISIEMMSVKLQQGYSRFQAASYAYTVTAFPMLTGTLITCVGFIPMKFAKSNASEMTGSLFYVVVLALIISWIVAAMITPLFGYTLIPETKESKKNIYDTKFYNQFKKILSYFLRHKKSVIISVVACFFLSIHLLGTVQQEFFPNSTRPELILDMTLPTGSSMQTTEETAKKLALFLSSKEEVASYSYYVGKGAPRFVLTFEPTLNKSNFAQFVIVAKDAQSRQKLEVELENLLQEKFTEVISFTKTIQTGPPTEYPVMFRVSGLNHNKVREIAEQVKLVMLEKNYLRNVNLDWNEKSKILKVNVDYDKAQILGINKLSLDNSLQAQISGVKISEFLEDDKTIDILFRIADEDRNSLEKIKNLGIYIGDGKYIPLQQIADISLEMEDGLIWRRDLKPTITVQATVTNEITGNDAATEIYEDLSEIINSLPYGYSIEVGSLLENSRNSAKSLARPLPVMFFLIVLLLMMQLQSVPKMILTLLTAPLGLIGVSFGLLITGRPMGFVVQLGILALFGIIIRNSVILIDQIDLQIKSGESVFDAVVNATVRRFRPIMLTAAAAIFAMIPLTFSAFWGPMAVALASGLMLATILTLLVLPAMYAIYYD